MYLNLNNIKQKITSLITNRNIGDKNIIIGLFIIFVFIFFVSLYYYQDTKKPGVTEENIVINKNNYRVTYNQKVDSYRVILKPNITNPENIIQNIEKDLKDNLSSQEMEKVKWDIPGTLLPKENTITEYSSEEELQKHLEKDIRLQQEFNNGDFLPEEGH